MAAFGLDATGIEAYPALYRDLTERPERVDAFFPLAPGQRAAWTRRATSAQAAWAEAPALQRRRALVAALTTYHDGVGMQPAQRRSLEALGRQDALVVVTGQQAGLLGGPLYTAYKALGAIIRAAEAAEHLGCPVVPVFWVASEDHDWSEVSHAQFAGPGGALERLGLDGDGGFRSAGHIPLPPEARRLTGRLTTLFPPSGEGAAVAEHLLAGLRRPGRQTLADWFAWQLHGLLGPLGLLLYDPMQPALRALATPVFAGAPSRAAAANARIHATGERLQAAGYQPGLDLEEDHVHLFVYHQGRRVALHAAGGRIRTKDGEVDLATAEVARLAAEDPTAFSPNVALRPIVQDFTLPVLCQLGGPGEVAYLAQLGGVFPLWDREAPGVTPRPGGTVALPADTEGLRLADAQPADLLDDPQGVIDRTVAARCPVDIDAVFAQERSALEARYAGLRAALAGVGAALPAIVDGNAARVRFQVDYLERKARQHRRRAQSEVTAVLRAASGRLFPGGALQERNSLLYPYLFTYGPAFLRELHVALAAAPGPFGRHWLFSWSD